MEKILHFFARYPIDFSAHISSIIPILVGLFRYRYLTANLKVVWLLFLINFIKDTYSLVILLLYDNNLYIQNIEPIYQTLLIGFVFYFSFDTHFSRRITAALTGIFILLSLVYYKGNEVSSVSTSAFRVFAIAVSLTYFNKIMMDMRVKSIMKYSMFWFVSGLLIYASGTFFIMLFREYWFSDIDKIPIEVFDKYWNSDQLLLILFALFSAIGLWASKYDSENLL